jgi:hypothetical protein
MPEGIPRVQQGYTGHGAIFPYPGDGSRFGFRLGGVASALLQRRLFLFRVSSWIAIEDNNRV